MQNNQVIYPSSLVNSTLPRYVVENYSTFVKFMTSAIQSNESIGFGKHILQNLQKYQSFQEYRNKIVEFGFLSVNLNVASGNITENVKFDEEGNVIDDIDDDISNLENGDIGIVRLTDYNGFPDENGILLIDDEIIYYKEKLKNTSGTVVGLSGLKRGASANTILPTFTSDGKFVDSVPATHRAGAKVYNLSVLFMIAMLNNIHESYTPTIGADRIFKDINHSLLLSNIVDFFRSKGNKLGIQSLFKMIFGSTNVDVKYPGDMMIIPSESTWIRDRVCKAVPMSTLFYSPGEIWTSPVGMSGYSAEIRSFNDNKVYSRFGIEFVTSYPYEDSISYDLTISEDNFSGDFKANPVTKLNVDITAATNTITVDSTENYPASGLMFIGDEAISYTSRSSNQFFGCRRGRRGFASSHSVGTTVYGPYYVYGSYVDSTGTKVTSRSWPSGLVSSVDILDPGILHSSDDVVEPGPPGDRDRRSMVLKTFSSTENYRNIFASVKNNSVSEINNFTYGINGVYFDDKNAYLLGNNLPNYPIGEFSNNNTVGRNIKPVSTIHIIPKTESIISLTPSIDLGFDEIGLFLDGVPAFSHTNSTYIQIGQFTVTSGASKQIDVIRGGSGYVNPTVIISKGENNETTDAEAILNNRGEITGIRILKSATYKRVPTITISSGDGANVVPTFGRSGELISTTVSGGQNYIDVPRLTLVDPKGTGRGATLTCTVRAGMIHRITIHNAGEGYSSSTYVNVIPVGSGAVVTTEIGKYHPDIVNEINTNLNYTFDDGNGFLFRDASNVLSRFGYVIDPKKLREQLGDNGRQHSPIIGWAFDGNPIYGPYGLIDGVITQHKSSYKLLPNRDSFVDIAPSVSDYPMGTFVEDYKYIPTHGTLDEHNGIFCPTPDFPEGTYCYFITLANSGKPIYPYIIGPTYKNVPIQQKNVSLENTTRFRRNNVSLPETNIEVGVSNTSRGNISDIFIQHPGVSNSAVGDFAYFDERNTQGSGALARVSLIRGQDIDVIGGSAITSRMISHRQRIDLSSVSGRERFFFAPGFIFETLETGNIARAVVERYYPGDFVAKPSDPDYAAPYVLIVNVVSEDLIREGDRFYDQRGTRVKIGNSSGSSAAIAPRGDLIIPAQSSEKVIPFTNNVTIFSYDPPKNRYDDNSIQPGDVWFSLQSGKLYVYYKDINTSQWVTTHPYNTAIGSIASSIPIGETGVNFIPTGITPAFGQVIISDTAPTKVAYGLSIGDMWWSPVTGILYIWNSDDGGQFVTCSCEYEGTPIEISEEWICTDPTGTVPQNVKGKGTPSPPVQPGNSISVGMNVIISQTSPGVRPDGTLWWSNESGKMYIRFNNTWVATNPTSHMAKGSWGNDSTPEVDVVNQVYGPLALLPESKTNDRLFFDSLCDFYPEDNVVFSTLVRNENSRIKIKESNLRFNAMTFYRDRSNAIELPDNTVLRNTSRYKIRVETKKPHKLKVGDKVYFNSTDEYLNKKPLTIVDVGYLDVATGYAVVRNNRVDRIVVTHPGNNYKVNFYVNIIGGGGSNARGLAIVRNGRVVEVNMQNRGRDYTSTPTIGFLDKCSWNYFTVYIDRQYSSDISDIVTSYHTDGKSAIGPVAEFDLVSGGFGYRTLPTIPGIYKRLIDRCITSVVMSGTTIKSINIEDGGNRYVNPIVEIWDDGTTARGAVATAKVSDGVVTSISVINGGVDYENPQILLYESAQLIPETENIGRINSFNVMNPGIGVNSNKSYKPSLWTETKLILKYNIPDVYSPKPLVISPWIPGERVYQGRFNNRHAAATVKSWDPDNQILSLISPNGRFKEGEEIRSVTDAKKIAIVKLSGQSNQELVVKGSSRPYGNFLNDKSFVGSPTARVQDSYFYQNFSYIIDSPLQRKLYESIVDRVVHPAGFIYFSELNISDQLQCPCNEEDFDLATYYQDLFPWVVPIGPNPPRNASEGDLWFDNVQGVLYIYYASTTGTEWVAAGTAGAIFTK